MLYIKGQFTQKTNKSLSLSSYTLAPSPKKKFKAAVGNFGVNAKNYFVFYLEKIKVSVS